MSTTHPQFQFSLRTLLAAPIGVAIIVWYYANFRSLSLPFYVMPFVAAMLISWTISVHLAHPPFTQLALKSLARERYLEEPVAALVRGGGLFCWGARFPVRRETCGRSGRRGRETRAERGG